MIEVFERENVTCAKVQISVAGQKANPVFIYLVDGMLTDTGPKNAETSIVPFYESHSFDLVTLTHSHEDHSGTAPWIEKNRKVPIYVHSNGVDICVQPYPYPLYRQMTWEKGKRLQPCHFKKRSSHVRKNGRSFTHQVTPMITFHFLIKKRDSYFQEICLCI